MSLKKILPVFVFLAVFAIGVYANQLTTTMTWNVPSNKSHSVAYGGSCSTTNFYFDEAAEPLAGPIDGNAIQVMPYNNTIANSGTACQSAATAAITVTNNGNVAENIDGNFATAFGGADANKIFLKVWMGTGSGCGASGLGGWQAACSVTSAANPVTQASCRQYGSLTATSTYRLVTSLPASDTNQLCFATDINGSLAQGSRNYTFQTNTS